MPHGDLTKSGRINWAGLRSWAPVILSLFLTAYAIGSAACSKQVMPYHLDEKRVRSVADEVMQDQSQQVQKQRGSIGTLDEQERSIVEYFSDRSDLAADALRRLGELYLNLEDSAYQQHLKVYKEQLLEFQEKKIPQKPNPPHANHARSMKVFQMLVDRYPDYPENDPVLYQLARVNDDIGQSEEAVRYLKRLIEQYPSSPYGAEAYFRLGEYDYDGGDILEALKAYKEVVSSPDTTFHAQALYKLGWTYHNMQDHRNAVAQFIRLADQWAKSGGRNVRLDPKALSTADRNLILEVMRSMAFAFLYLGEHKSGDQFEPAVLANYFDQIGQRDYEYLVYRKVGELLRNQRRIREGIAVYEAFLKRYPQHNEAPMFALAAVDAYTQLKVLDLGNQARIRFVESFSEDSEWYQKATPETRARIRPIYKKLLNQLALFYHFEAQQNKRQKDYEKAITWYRKFLNAFPKEGESGHINFLLAETLYELGRYSEAAEEYDRTAYSYFLHQDSLEAGYAAMVAYDKGLAGISQEQLRNHPLAIKLGGSAKRFAESFPSDPRVADVLWKGTGLYFTAGQYKEAIATAQTIVKRFMPSRHPVAFQAQRLIADALFQARSYQEAAEAYRQIFTTATGLDDKEREKLKRALASSLYKKAELMKEAGRAEDAEAGFLRVQQEVPGSEVAPVALFDAGALALQRGAVNNAVQTFQVLTQQYPTHAVVSKVAPLMLQAQQRMLSEGRQQEAEELAEKIRTLKTPAQDLLGYQSQRLIADKYFEQKQYDKAADAYRQMLSKPGLLSDLEREQIQRLRAASLYKYAEGLKAAGRLAEAEAGFLQVQQEVPKSDVAPVALFDAGAIALEHNNTAAALKAYQSLIQLYPHSEYASHASVGIAQIYEQQGKTAEAAQQYQQVAQLTADRRVAGDALWAAANLNEKRKDWRRTAQLYQEYADHYGGDFERAMEARFKVIVALQAMEQHAQAKQKVQEFLDTYGQRELGNTKAAYYLAKCRLIEAEYLKQQYAQVKLQAPLEDNLAKKKELLKKVLDLYIQASEAKVAEVTTEATYQIGLVFEDFRNALLESERPLDLTAQQLEQYDFLLEEQAYPFEEQAILAYQTNVRRAQESGIYDVWVKKSYEELARLVPARYKREELEEMLPRQITSSRGMRSR